MLLGGGDLYKDCEGEYLDFIYVQKYAESTWLAQVSDCSWCSVFWWGDPGWPQKRMGRGSLEFIWNLALDSKKAVLVRGWLGCRGLHVLLSCWALLITWLFLSFLKHHSSNGSCQMHLLTWRNNSHFRFLIVAAPGPCVCKKLELVNAYLHLPQVRVLSLCWSAQGTCESWTNSIDRMRLSARKPSLCG